MFAVGDIVRTKHFKSRYFFVVRTVTYLHTSHEYRLSLVLSSSFGGSETGFGIDSSHFELVTSILREKE